MKGYIIDPHYPVGSTHYEPPIIVDIVSYKLPISVTSIASSGEITIAGTLPTSAKFKMLRVDEYPGMFWRISSLDSSDGTTTRVTVSDALSFLGDGYIFNDPAEPYSFSGNLLQMLEYTMPFTPTGQSTEVFRGRLYGRYNASCFRWSNYEPTSGALYTKIMNTPNIPFEEYNENNAVNREAFARYLIASGFLINNLRFSYDTFEQPRLGERTEMFIVADLGVSAVGETQVIPFNDGHSFLDSASFNDDICTMVVFEKLVYQLRANGTVVQDDDVAHQLPGYVRSAEFSPPDTAPIVAAQIFAENSNEHKVEFRSDRKLQAGQPVRLLLDNRVFDTSVSSAFVTDADTMYHYVCGELPVTGVDKIRDDGWGYGSRLPNAPRKGELFFKR